MATLVQDLLIGAGAGIVGGFALSGAAAGLYTLTSPENVRRETEIEPRNPYIVLTQKVEALTGVQLSEAQEKHSELAIATGMAAVGGAVYAAVARQWSLGWLAGGAVFGAMFWAVGDEGMGTALGLVGDNTKYPAEAHLRGLAAHTVFGVVTAALVEALNRPATSRPRPARDNARNRC